MWSGVLAIVALAGTRGVSAQMYNSSGLVFPDCARQCFNYGVLPCRNAPTAQEEVDCQCRVLVLAQDNLDCFARRCVDSEINPLIDFCDTNTYGTSNTTETTTTIETSTTNTETIASTTSTSTSETESATAGLVAHGDSAGTQKSGNATHAAAIGAGVGGGVAVAILAGAIIFVIIRKRRRNARRWGDKGFFEVDEDEYCQPVHPFTVATGPADMAAANTATPPIPLAPVAPAAAAAAVPGPSAKHLEAKNWEATERIRAYLTPAPDRDDYALTSAGSSSRLTSAYSSTSGTTAPCLSVPPSSDAYSEDVSDGVPYHAEDAGLLAHETERGLELPPMYNPQWSPGGSEREAGSESGRSDVPPPTTTG